MAIPASTSNLRTNLALCPRSFPALILTFFAASAGATDVPFASGATVSSDAFASSLADVDGDGDLDAIGSDGTAGASWFENLNGDGSSWSTARVVGATDAGIRAAADIDGDGDTDLVGTGGPAGTLLFWHENLNGVGTSWSGAQIIPSVVNDINGMAIGDIDGDGDPDIVGSKGASTYWWENDVGGTGWTAHFVYSDGNSTSRVRVADFDRDGDLDVATLSISSPRVSWHRNDLGDGTSWTFVPVDASATNVRDFDIGDVDRDGELDVVASFSVGDSVLYLNTGGSFSSSTIAGSGPNSQVELSDIDADGDLDAVHANTSTDTLAWMENTDGTGGTWSSRSLGTLTEVFSMSEGDIDGDRDLDLIASGFPTTVTEWFENEGIHRSAAFQGPEFVVESFASARSVSADDLDADGDLDLVALANLATGELNWYANQGDDPPTWSASPIATGLSGDVGFSVVADLDADGDGDVVAGHGGPGATDEVLWFENDGAGGTWTSSVIDATALRPVGLTTADLEGDGDLDVILASGAPTDAYFWYENDGAGGGWTKRQVGSQSGSWHSVPADLDGDGDLDLVGCGMNITTNVVWFENDGSPEDDLGPWTKRTIPTVGTNARQCGVGDLDADGDLDVVVPFLASNEVAWYENDGGSVPTFSEHLLFSAFQTQPHDVSVGDFDRDGDLDFAVGAIDTTGVDLSWWENDGTGLFTTHIVDDNALGAADTLAADLDGNGQLDLVAVAPAMQKINAYLNLGGQFALPTTNVSYLGMVDIQQREVFQIGALHRGRAGDTDAELATLELRVEDGVGTPLTSAQANALISSLTLYLDDGDGSFELASDTVVATVTPFVLTSGVQIVTLTDGDPNLQVSQGAPKSYFVVAQIASGASAQTPSAFQIFHRSESGSTAENRDNDSLLSLEFEADTGTGVIQTLPWIGDADGDGLQNLFESTLGTDALNSDTDGDGIDDGDEVNTYTSDPLDTDTDDDGLDDGAEVALGTSPTNPDDDGDKICDGDGTGGGSCTAGPDNCPFIDNLSQTNGDVLGAGDACQCGDVNDDGTVTALDVAAVREDLVNQPPSGTFNENRCDVAGSAACGVDDVFALERAAAGDAAFVNNSCPEYFSQP